MYGWNNQKFRIQSKMFNTKLVSKVKKKEGVVIWILKVDLYELVPDATYGDLKVIDWKWYWLLNNFSMSSFRCKGG